MRGTKLVALVLVVLMMFALTGCDLFGGGTDDSDDGGTSVSVPSGVVRVSLEWDDPVDLDLEMWDADGESALFMAGTYSGEDVMEGPGEEYFDFKAYGDEDFSTGDYVISVYFANEENVQDAADATLSVTDADGDTRTFDITVYWEPGRDQYHAFRIDAASGAVDMIEEYIEIEIEE